VVPISVWLANGIVDCYGKESVFLVPLILLTSACLDKLYSHFKSERGPQVFLFHDQTCLGVRSTPHASWQHQTAPTCLTGQHIMHDS